VEVTDEKLPPLAPPEPARAQIILPGPSQTISETATQLAALMACRDYFRRGSEIVRVIDGPRGPTLESLGVQLFRSEAESLGELVRWGEPRRGSEDGPRLVPSRMSVDDANALLVAVCRRLPTLRAMVRFPPLQADGSVQSSRYDPESGLFCTGPTEIPKVPIADAVEWLGHRGLLRDFWFQTPGDASRLMAALLAPALRFGPWRQSTAPFPLFLTEADQSQSGKGFASEMIAVLYGEHLANVPQQGRGGVGSFDEKIQSELQKGRPLVCLDNLRGTINSPLLESFMTARGAFPLRAFFREGETDSRAHLLFATSNGVQLTEDLANRSLVIRIKKRPEYYQWYHWPEGGVTGDLLEHVAAHRARYLGAVYAVVRVWLEAGMPTSATGHAFRDAVGALNWMVTRVLGWPEIVDFHRSVQEWQSNPVLGFLRVFAQTAGPGEYYASDFVEGAEEHSLALPEAVQRRREPDGARQAMGRLLAGVFKTREAVCVEEWTIERVQVPRWDGGGGFQRAYRFSRPEPRP
jgi:hypothetical protein